MITMLTLNIGNLTNLIGMIDFDANMNPLEDKEQENDRSCHFYYIFVKLLLL